jgi:hypothetical protein
MQTAPGHRKGTEFELTASSTSSCYPKWAAERDGHCACLD